MNERAGSAGAERTRRCRARQERRARGAQFLSDVPVDDRTIPELVRAGVLPAASSDVERGEQIGALLDLLATPRMLAAYMIAFERLARDTFGNDVTAGGYSESGTRETGADACEVSTSTETT